MDSLSQIDGCLVRIRMRYPSLRSSEQRVADWILKNSAEAVRISITELAKQVGVSESTVARFSQSLEFSGFQDLKIALAQELIPLANQVHEQVEPEDDESAIIAKVCQANARVAQETERILDPLQLRQAVDSLVSAQVVTVLGMGGSGAVATDLHNRLLRLGLVSRLFHDSHFQAMSTAVSIPGHVVIGVTASGRSREIVEAMSLARQAGARTIAITNHLNVPVRHYSDIVLLAAPAGEWSAGVATNSRLSQLCVVDALYVALALRSEGRLARNLITTKNSLKWTHLD